MAEIVYGDQVIQEPTRRLVDLFASERFDGTFYIGYPILANVDGAVRVDALYVSQNFGIVIFDLTNLNFDPENQDKIEEVRIIQNKYFAAMQSKLLETPDLLVRRRLVVPITTITVSIQHDFADEDVIVSRIESIPTSIFDGANLSNAQFQTLNSVIERTATIRPRKKRSNITRGDSKGSVIRELEKQIANLDASQKRAAIEIPTAPQRIRGLAGSGKTIVLALKAAFLHSREPDWRIVLTFQTRALYQQFLRLVRQFCFEFAKQEPDWEKLTVIHAWGSSSTRGVYSEIANVLGMPVVDFGSARDKYGIGNAFSGICADLIQNLKNDRTFAPIYDAILIDEAQDLPQSFFELVYLSTKNPKRIVYAYDELQNLSDFSMVPAEDLFGKKRNGHANVQIKNELGKPRRDIILPVCYRNTPWALSTAHGLGFGIARDAGLIQLFDDLSLWREIGYEIADGDLAYGRDVSLRRAANATPRYFGDMIRSNDAVVFEVFNSPHLEMEWLARSISTNLNADELEHDDILIVVPEAIAIRSIAPKIMRALRVFDISSHLVGVTTSRDEVFAKGSVAITSIYRAKGNEAPMAYVVGAEYCYGGYNLARKRNVLFTAITRSRAWVRVSGVGEGMRSLIDEYERIRNDDFYLRFRYPTLQQIQQIKTLHRDRSSDEISEIENDLEGLSRLVRRVETGQISLDALPLEAQRLVRRLADENTRSPRSNRRAD